MKQGSSEFKKPRGVLNSQLAMKGEEAAAKHMRDLGYRIIARNWRAGRYGELDIIADSPQGVLTFVEVKTRRSYSQTDERQDLGFQSVDGLKQHKILRMAERYLVATRINENAARCKFDVIIVHFRFSRETREEYDEPELFHVENAFHNIGWA